MSVPNSDSDSSSTGQRTVGVDRTPISAFRRRAYISVAGFFFLLGAIGAILPGLPATPFLLLTSYFLVRASPRLNEKLLRTRLFGPILLDWQERKGLRLHVKIQAITFVVLAVTLTVAFSTFAGYVKLLIAAAASIGILVIARLPNAVEE